jgi:bacterioferritin-associated ferredoxin
MYVCICNAITDKQIRQAAESGVANLWELQKELGVASNCGSCKEAAAQILQENRPTREKFEPRVYVPSTA